MKNNSSTFIAVSGVIILSIFSFIIAKNILPGNDNDKFYAKPNEDMIARIDKVEKENNKLIITTIGNPTEYCLKTTKSIPEENSLCWNKIENNKVEVPYFKYKKYYVWIKDTEGRISGRTIIDKE
ncbi:MAG: hypothetical protein ACI4VL_00790 [Bacilli bacterium]